MTQWTSTSGKAPNRVNWNPKIAAPGLSRTRRLKELGTTLLADLHAIGPADEFLQGPGTAEELLQGPASSRMWIESDGSYSSAADRSVI